MNNQLREEDILAYIEGELSDTDARALESLLSQDPDLKRFVDGARSDQAAEHL